MQENGILRALSFKFYWGSMPQNPPSLVGANHSCKIVDPPLLLFQKIKNLNRTEGQFSPLDLACAVKPKTNLPGPIPSPSLCEMLSVVTEWQVASGKWQVASKN